MNNRSVILLAIGMLILGLAIGVAVGGVGGFVAGQSARVAFSRTVPQFNFPIQPNQPAPQPLNPPSGNQPRQNVATNGARVTQVEKDSPAEKAGLQAGDVITAVDGTKIDDTHSLADLIGAKKPGDKVALAITRGNQTQTLTVELGKATDGNAAFLGVRYAPIFSGTGGRFRQPGLPNDNSQGD